MPAVSSATCAVIWSRSLARPMVLPFRSATDWIGLSSRTIITSGAYCMPSKTTATGCCAFTAWNVCGASSITRSAWLFMRNAT